MQCSGGRSSIPPLLTAMSELPSRHPANSLIKCYLAFEVEILGVNVKFLHTAPET